jgi:dCTP deaminase
MSVLKKNDILDYIYKKAYKTRLVITPLLEERQIGPGSIDVRLGTSIIVPKKTYVDSQDVTVKEKVLQVENRSYDRVRLRPGTKFVLHPHQLILGVTFEYIALPRDIFANIASRSSWGRLGLVVATASVIQPGFKGCITLELCNLGESPIALYPGLLVGQLVLYKVEGTGAPDIYDGRYDCPTEAGLPNFLTKNYHNDIEVWRKILSV